MTRKRRKGIREYDIVEARGGYCLEEEKNKLLTTPGGQRESGRNRCHPIFG